MIQILKYVAVELFSQYLKTKQGWGFINISMILVRMWIRSCLEVRIQKGIHFFSVKNRIRLMLTRIQNVGLRIRVDINRIRKPKKIRDSDPA